MWGAEKKQKSPISICSEVWIQEKKMFFFSLYNPFASIHNNMMLGEEKHSSSSSATMNCATFPLKLTARRAAVWNQASRNGGTSKNIRIFSASVRLNQQYQNKKKKLAQPHKNWRERNSKFVFFFSLKRLSEKWELSQAKILASRIHFGLVSLHSKEP